MNSNRKNFDSRFMKKRRPKIPVKYQPNLYLRTLGVISPSLRMAHWNRKYELDYVKWLCYQRKLRRDQWKALYKIVRIMEKLKEGAL